MDKPSLVTMGEPYKPELLSPYATFKVNGLGDYNIEDANKTYFNPDECELFFFYGIDDSVKYIPFSKMCLENNKLYFSTNRLGFETLADLEIKNQLKNYILLVKPYEWNIIKFDKIYEDEIQKLFGISNVRDFCLENVEKDYLNTLKFNIMNFESNLRFLNENILKDEKYIDYKNKYIKNFKKDIENSVKFGSLDTMYYEYDVDDEYFFYIAKFYGNIDYLPDILKEDFREIYWR